MNRKNFWKVRIRKYRSQFYYLKNFQNALGVDNHWIFLYLSIFGFILSNIKNTFGFHKGRASQISFNMNWNENKWTKNSDNLSQIVI